MALARRLSRLLSAAILAAAPVAAAQSLQGTWVLDLKASQNVPDAQKGVDLKVMVRGNELTILREVSGKTIGTPLLYTLDGVTRQMDVGGGQRAAVEARWLIRGTTVQQVIKMPTPGSLTLAVQTTVMEVSPDGNTLKRAQTLVQGGETTDRMMVYRRKTE